jgi:hypothetical protein
LSECKALFNWNLGAAAAKNEKNGQMMEEKDKHRAARVLL